MPENERTIHKKLSENAIQAVFVSIGEKSAHSLCFEGTAEGLKCCPSVIPDKALALAPQQSQYVVIRQLAESREKRHYDDGGDDSRYIPAMNITEPFLQFEMELHFEHPYRKTIRCGMADPVFSDIHPDVNDYLNDYHREMKKVEQLVRAFMLVAFPNIKE